LEEFDGFGGASEVVEDEYGIGLVFVGLADFLASSAEILSIVVELADDEIVGLSLHDFEYVGVLIFPVGRVRVDVSVGDVHVGDHVLSIIIFEGRILTEEDVVSLACADGIIEQRHQRKGVCVERGGHGRV